MMNDIIILLPKLCLSQNNNNKKILYSFVNKKKKKKTCWLNFSISCNTVTNCQEFGGIDWLINEQKNKNKFENKFIFWNTIDYVIPLFINDHINGCWTIIILGTINKIESSNWNVLLSKEVTVFLFLIT